MHWFACVGPEVGRWRGGLGGGCAWVAAWIVLDRVASYGTGSGRGFERCYAVCGRSRPVGAYGSFASDGRGSPPSFRHKFERSREPDNRTTTVPLVGGRARRRPRPAP